MKRAVWIVAAVIACDPASPPGDPGVTETEDPPFATFLDLHAGVIARTCSPNPGVCHAANSYPDLSTAGTALLAITAPCNLSTPEPLRGFDACERRGDHVVAEGIDSELAWIGPLGDAAYQIAMREPAPATGRFDVHFEREGHVVYTLRVIRGIEARLAIDTIEGSNTATVGAYAADPSQQDLLSLIYGGAERALIGGDPNRNRIFGAEHELHAKVIDPGRLDTSYLWGRITGTMPGTRMPLANQPLSAEEYVAIGCWIEGLARTSTPAVEDVIDYERCAFKSEAIDYSMR